MPYMLQLSKPKSFVPTPEEIAALDKMSEDLQVVRHINKIFYLIGRSPSLWYFQPNTCFNCVF